MSASQTLSARASLPTDRLILAESALLEITQISEALRDFIAARDETGAIEPLARGMLARVQTLSESVSDCLHGADGEPSVDGLTRIVHCRGSSAPAGTAAAA